MHSTSLPPSRSRSRRSRAALPVALLVAAALAGCGGGDDEPAATATATPAAGGGAADGAQLFSATCASCHTLAAAKADGSVGPNLDDVKPDADRVRAAITSGPGVMPENLLTGEQADAVAAYVAENAGR